MRRSKVAPRKQASSSAGATITTSLLDAAENILSTDGLAGFTTNRVAGLAGVSVGSLYQYFPNKEAILAAIARRHERRTEERIRTAFEETPGAPLATTAARVVDALLSQDIGAYQLRRILRAEVPAAWTLETSEDVDTNVRSMLTFIISHHPDVRTGNHALMAWIIGHSIELAVEAAVLTRPELLGSAVFRAELIELATRYLRA